MTHDTGPALDAARRYRGLGFQPLPSRRDRKAPALASFAEYWEEPLPSRHFDAWPTPNIQLMTGARWGLAVIDCDGDDAHATWRRMKEAHGEVGPMPTWVARTGGGGWHYYFALPAWLDACPTRRIWGRWDTYAGPKRRGDWVKHQEVRLLGEKALAVAPPSLHVATGEPYRWLDGRGPDDFDRPMAIPPWVLVMPEVTPPAPPDRPPPYRGRTPARARDGPRARHHDRGDVLAAIPDKAALAASWGLRLAAAIPNAAGWILCHAIDRDDRIPSAGFHADHGTYSELREGAALSLFDLAVALGAYLDWQAAVNDLGELYRANPRVRGRA